MITQTAAPVIRVVVPDSGAGDWWGGREWKRRQPIDAAANAASGKRYTLTDAQLARTQSRIAHRLARGTAHLPDNERGDFGRRLDAALREIEAPTEQSTGSVASGVVAHQIADAWTRAEHRNRAQAISAEAAALAPVLDLTPAQCEVCLAYALEHAPPEQGEDVRQEVAYQLLRYQAGVRGARNPGALAYHIARVTVGHLWDRTRARESLSDYTDNPVSEQWQADYHLLSPQERRLRRDANRRLLSLDEQLDRERKTGERETGEPAHKLLFAIAEWETRTIGELDTLQWLRGQPTEVKQAIQDKLAGHRLTRWQAQTLQELGQVAKGFGLI